MSRMLVAGSTLALRLGISAKCPLGFVTVTPDTPQSRWSYGNHRSYKRCNTRRGAVSGRVQHQVLYPWNTTAHAPHDRTQYLRTITPHSGAACAARCCATCVQMTHARTHRRTHTHRDTTYKHARMYSPARTQAATHARTHARTRRTHARAHGAGGQGGSALRPASRRLPSVLPSCSRRRRRPPSADTCVETRAPQGAVVRA